MSLDAVCGLARNFERYLGFVLAKPCCELAGYLEVSSFKRGFYGRDRFLARLELELFSTVDKDRICNKNQRESFLEARCFIYV